MNSSPTVGALAAALAKAQGQMNAAPKSSDNPFFKSKYADLASIVDAIKGPLSSNGLAYAQLPELSEDGTVRLETVLMHASGEWISGTVAMRPVKNDPQGIGSCLTYARRYGLQAIVGIPADDDDGNEASHPQPQAELKDIPNGQRPKQAPAANGKRPFPKEPKEVQGWFAHELSKSADLKWTEQDHIRQAQNLARTLKDKGMTDDERAHLYDALFGVRSGKDMPPALLLLIGQQADHVEEYKALAAWWRESAASEGAA